MHLVTIEKQHKGDIRTSDSSYRSKLAEGKIAIYSSIEDSNYLYIGLIIDDNEEEITILVSSDVMEKYDFNNKKYFVSIKENRFGSNFNILLDENLKCVEPYKSTTSVAEFKQCFDFYRNKKLLDDLNKNSKVLIRYHKELYPNLQEIEVFEKGDFIDLRSAEYVSMKAGEYKAISLGVSMKLPEGYWGQLCPRSSLFKNHGILVANSFGVIDESYCGDDDIWKLAAYATRDTIIEANERIAQFRIVKKQPFTIESVEKLNGENRGGFGSTGTK